MAKPLPSVETLRRLFRFDPETGDLIYKPRAREDFPSRWAFLVWNKRYSNKPARSPGTGGYYKAGVYNRQFPVHRLIWKMAFGYDPIGIDHIDGDPKNNRLSNLRNCNQSVNNKNRAISSNNTSGHMGVYWNKKLKKWYARIYEDNKYTDLGMFYDFADAVAARERAEKQFGYHENHGRPAGL